MISIKNNKSLFIHSITILFLILIIFFIMPASTQARLYDPSLDWQTTESEHFLVIFPGKSPIQQSFDYQNTVLNVLNIAEETYQQVTPHFGEPFHKNQKIAIILEDFSDSVYGFASVLPHRLIRINLTAPGFKIFDTRFENWLKILITHEYTHLAHFDMTRNGTTFLRFFLGQVIAPNALQPMWATEGLAIYNESKWTTGGRMVDNRYDMYLRSDFLNDRPKELNLLQSSYLTSWPGGNAPYIYGQSLVHYIVQKFGEKKLIAISEKFCSNPLLGMNWALKKVLGINQNELYENWQEEQLRHYKNQLEEIYQFSQPTESEQITNHRYWVDNPHWCPKNIDVSPSLLYKVNSTELYPTIRSYNPVKKEENIVINRTNGHGSSYSLSPDGKCLLYSKLLYYDEFYQYYDLFLYHLETEKQIRISEGMRIKDPSWHPDNDNNSIVAVINHAGTNNLVLFTLEKQYLEFLNENYKNRKNNSITPQLLTNENLTSLTKFDDGTQIAQPSWSPDGRKIAFSMWKNGFQDIYILKLDENNQVENITPITRDRHTDISPNWSPTGEYIYFSSDRSSIFNLYAYNIKDKQLFRLTNVITGAFEPSVSPNGKELAFIQYHTSGYELHLTKTKDLLWKPVDTEDDSLYQKTAFQPNKAMANGEPSPVLDYSPWDNIWPTYWTPYLTLTSDELYLGFSSLAQDYLKFYNLSYKLAWGAFTPSLYYDIDFTDYSQKPFFTISWQGETLLAENKLSNFFDAEYTNATLQAKFVFPGEGYTSQQDSARYFSENFSLGFQNELYSFKKTEDDNSEPSYNKINSLILSYNYSDTEIYKSSISPEIGSSFSLSYQHANKMLGSDSNFHKILFDGRKYFPLPGRNQVMAFRLVAGSSTENLNQKEKFYLGGNSNNTKYITINNSSFPLRGFPSSYFSGNNLLASSLEYRFPIKEVEKKIGFDWASIFLERISGALFLDAGQTWEGKIAQLPSQINAAIGAELNFKFNQAQNNPFIVTIGTGKALSEPSQFRFYFQTGISF
jgi:Tol biopolymer transport system component